MITKGQPLSDDMFYMWRCVVRLAWADGHVHDEERAYFEKVFTSMDRAGMLTPEQKSTFTKELEAPGSGIAELLSLVKDPACRSQLLYFCGQLVRADGVVDPHEDDIIKKLGAHQMARLDLDKIRADVSKVLASESLRRDLKVDELRSRTLIPNILNIIRERLGIDLLD